MLRDTPGARWRAMEQLANPARRGRALEQFTAELFRAQHFSVQLDPGTVRPRQADVLAVRGGERYLIECKWRSDKATTDDLDALRSRLRRAGGDLVGILVSVAGFSGSVLHDVEHHRDEPILLVSQEELKLVAAGLGSLQDLLWRKKEALLTSGTVLLDEPRRSRRARRRPLPESTARFVPAREPDSPVISFGGEFSPLVFAPELPDLDWVAATGPGVTLDIAPEVGDERGLEDLLQHLAGLGWASPAASWSIQQSSAAWHGLGPAAFRSELRGWRQRAVSDDAHLSEEIHYVDRCDGGFYTLSGTLLAHHTRRAVALKLSFQLQGIPLDTGSLLQLCREFGVHDHTCFRPRNEPSVVRSRLPDGRTSELKLLGLLVQRDHDPDAAHRDWVTGIVAANPFPEGQDLSDGLADAVRVLAGSEYLICALQHHHPFDGAQRTYHLTRLDHAWSSGLMVCRPVAAWDDPFAA